MSELPDGELLRVKRERDLYRQLLELGRCEELQPLLREALRLVVEVTGARQGYLELHDQSRATGQLTWSISQGFAAEEMAQVRAYVSSGIISEAIASGRTIQTASARTDDRFHDSESVRNNQIDAVLCAPVGKAPPIGVLYLQGRELPGAFSAEDQQLVEMLATHFAPLASRLLTLKHALEAADPTRPLRDKLKADSLVGQSRAMAEVLQQIALLAPLDVHVLITGPTGSGKTAVAKVIAENSPRASAPFVELNCGTIPEGLVESELFGAMPGAHATATRRIVGKVAAAEGGVLLLDEIGDLPPASQAKLLQLLQSKQYYPLGSSQPVQADVRIIAATNRDLTRAVAENRFREDLLYRLQILPVRMPGLDERAEDIRPLAIHLCREACARHRLPATRLSSQALWALEQAEWPGHVRQLANAVEAGVIRAQTSGRQVVEPEHIFPDKAGDEGDGEAEARTFHAATRRFQIRLLAKTLAETDWNIAETARRLDLARSHVYNLIRDAGLRREKP